MAVLLDLPPTNVTDVREVRADDDRLTHKSTANAPSRDEPRFPRHSLLPRGGTGTRIRDRERGDDHNVDRNTGEFRRKTYADRVDAASSNGETIRLRSEAAREVRNVVEELIPLIGQALFPTKLQFLKRALSRCHDQLRDRPTESSFLSIVTLIEGTVAQQKWKEYSAEQLELIRSAADIGYRQTKVSFADYDEIRRKLGGEHIDSHPRIDLDALSLDDLTDDEEAQTPDLS